MDEPVYLGKKLGSDGRRKNVWYNGPNHLLTFGPPGASKTTGLIVPNVAHLRRSMLIMDPKGQIAAITARARAKLGRVIVINPMNVLPGLPQLRSYGFNPLAGLDPSDPKFAARAHNIGAAIIPEAPGKDQFFTSTAIGMIQLGVMWAVMKRGQYAHLLDVKQMLCGPDFIHELKDMADSTFYPVRDEARLFLARLGDKRADTTSLQDTIFTVNTYMQFLNLPELKNDMENGYIDFAAMRDEIITIYMVLPTDDMAEQTAYLRMFLATAFRSLTRNPVLYDPRIPPKLPPILIFLEEFARLGKMNEITNALTTSRDYRMQMWFYLQDINQLKTTYGDSFYETFATGSGAITSFANRDVQTGKWLSEFIGDYEFETLNLSDNRDGKNKGSNTGLTTSRLMPASEFVHIPAQKQFVFLQGKRPFFCDVPVYADTEFGYGLDPNPYYHPPKPPPSPLRRLFG